MDDCAVRRPPSPSPPSGSRRQDTARGAAKPRRMRNRALHDALRDFALEAAALLTEELKAGAELEFDVVDEGGGRGPALYRYEPRTGAFIDERWARLRELPAYERACARAGRRRRRVAARERAARRAGRAGAARDARAPVRGRHQLRLPRGALRARLRGGRADAVPRRRARARDRAACGARGWRPTRVELGDGLSLVRGDAASTEAATSGDGEPPAACSSATCRRTTRFRPPRPAPLPGSSPRCASGRPAASRSARPAGGRPTRAAGSPGARRPARRRAAASWMLPAGEEQAFREFLAAIDGRAAARDGGLGARPLRDGLRARGATPRRCPTTCWRCARCSTPRATRARRASALRLAALCAEEGSAARCSAASRPRWRSSGS